MANFDSSDTRRESIKRANNLLDLIRHIYVCGKEVQGSLALYQTGTDPAFNAAINAMYTASERTELGAMLTQINALVTDWATNHTGAIGGA